MPGKWAAIQCCVSLGDNAAGAAPTAERHATTQAAEVESALHATQAAEVESALQKLIAKLAATTETLDATTEKVETAQIKLDEQLSQVWFPGPGDCGRALLSCVLPAPSSVCCDLIWDVAAAASCVLPYDDPDR